MFGYFILNKTTRITEYRSTVLQNLSLQDASIFNELVIKKDPIKKVTPFFCFMEGDHLPHGQLF